MKSVCSIHEQAYDVGEHCPYCEIPEAEATDRDWAAPAPIVVYNSIGAPVSGAGAIVHDTTAGWVGGIWDLYRQVGGTVTPALRIAVAADLLDKGTISATQALELVGVG